MVDVYGDADAMKYVGDGRPLDRDACAKWAEITVRNYDTRGYGMFAIIERATGDTIGFCGLVHPGGQEDPELKYALRRDAWGKGYASEVAPAMLAYAAARHARTRVIATADPDHAVSHRILRRAGMADAPPRHNDDGSTTLVFVWHAPGTTG
jgi:RimJ/RimL family protein N-acetyltransferase